MRLASEAQNPGVLLFRGVLCGIALCVPSPAFGQAEPPESAPQVSPVSPVSPVPTAPLAPTETPTDNPAHPGSVSGTSEAEPTLSKGTAAPNPPLNYEPPAAPSNDGIPAAPARPPLPTTIEQPVALTVLGRDPNPSPSGSAWRFGGYGELLFTSAFYHPDVTKTDKDYRDMHLDLTRLSFSAGTDLSKRISFFTELEFEHGGTGVAREVEWEEFGEYEVEVEKGGEVNVEQAYLEARLTDIFTVRAGRMLIPVGMTSLYHTPNLFSSVRRPESEAQILPSIWFENGVELSARWLDFLARFQVVTGLDSTGFSSNRWIAGGTQRAFERPLLNDVATVFALDYLGLPGLVLGVSGYTSGANRNRPKRDFYDEKGRVTLGDVHLRFQRGPLKVRALLLGGFLSNADGISRANASLSSELGASRTAIGSAAYAGWAEVAYNCFSLLPDTSQHLDVFVRGDVYDSMWKAAKDFDNPILERRAVTVGLNYFPIPKVVVKAEYVSRWLNEESRWARRQTELNAALGFVL